MSQPKVICHIAQAQGNGYEILRHQPLRLKSAREQSFLVVDIVSLKPQSLQARKLYSTVQHAKMQTNVEEVPQSNVDCHAILILHASFKSWCVPGAMKLFFSSFGASESADSDAAAAARMAT